MIFTIIFALLVGGMVLALIRLVMGPSLPDRVVALDLMATLSVGVIGTYALQSGQALFIDVAVVLALLAFLGTVAFANYIELGELP